MAYPASTSVLSTNYLRSVPGFIASLSLQTSAVQANNMHRRVFPTEGTKSSFYIHTIEWAGEPLVPLKIESANCSGLTFQMQSAYLYAYVIYSAHAKCVYICTEVTSSKA